MVQIRSVQQNHAPSAIRWIPTRLQFADGLTKLSADLREFLRKWCQSPWVQLQQESTTKTSVKFEIEQSCWFICIWHLRIRRPVHDQDGHMSQYSNSHQKSAVRCTLQCFEQTGIRAHPNVRKTTIEGQCGGRHRRTSWKVQCYSTDFGRIVIDKWLCIRAFTMASTLRALPCFGRLCCAVIWPGDANAWQSSATESSTRKIRIRWIRMQLNDTLFIFFPECLAGSHVLGVWGLRSVRPSIWISLCCKTWPRHQEASVLKDSEKVSDVSGKIWFMVSYRIVSWKCPTKASQKSVSQECFTTNFSEGVPQECLPRVSCKLQEPSFKSTVPERRTSVSIVRFLRRSL